MVHKLKTIRADMLVLQCQLERELIRYVKRYLCQPQVTIITNDTLMSSAGIRLLYFCQWHREK